MTKSKKPLISYEISDEIMHYSGMDEYMFDTRYSGAYLIVNDQKIDVELNFVSEHFYSLSQTCDDYTNKPLPMNEREVDEFIKKERVTLSPEALEEAISFLAKTLPIYNELQAQRYSVALSEKLEEARASITNPELKKISDNSEDTRGVLYANKFNETFIVNIGKAVFNTLFLEEYRQQLISQANQRREETVRPTEFIYINPAMTNPKTGEDVRQQEKERLRALRVQGKKIIGLEMTVPDLAKYCHKNIDPQHTEGNADECCAKTVAENAATLLGDYRGQDVVFVTNRVDLDSIAAYVIGDRYLQGETTEYNDSLAQINEHDAHLGEEWKGPKPIEQAFDPDNKPAALASTIKVFMVTPKNIEDVRTFIDTGNVEESTMDNYRTVQRGIIERVKSGEIRVDVVGGVAYVETPLPCATNVGYSFAPVVVATNPTMRNPDGTTYRKVSICQHEAGYVDLEAVKRKLATNEAGWGGSPTFIGSPQGQDCTTELSDIKKLVYANLTPKYKTKLTSRDANSGTDYEK